MDYREKSIGMLNQAVGEELHACHQYMYFHFRLEDAGYRPLAMLFHRIGIVEMRHVEDLAERILFLKGDVAMRPSANVDYIHDVEEMLEKAILMEIESVALYNERAMAAGEAGDSATKTLFEELVRIEEEHQDIFETELENLRNYPDQYLSLQAHEQSKKVAE